MSNLERLSVTGECRPLEEAELPKMREFLLEAFSLTEIPRNWQDDALRWKCLTPHPFWSDNRAWARLLQGRIVAAGCLVPLRMRMEGGSVPCAHIIDWGASRQAPGAGIQLYLHMASLAGPVFGIGGSADTRRILPGLGARIAQEAAIWSRMLRPLREFRGSRKDWKTPARLARDVMRALPPVPRPSEGWSAALVPRFERSAWIPAPAPSAFDAVVPERSPELLNYWMDCPCARVLGFVLRHGKESVAYFLLSDSPPECRIADLWVCADDEELWLQAYRAAYHAAIEHSHASRLVTMNCLESAGRALEKLHFQKRTESVFLLDPKKRLPVDKTIALSMTDFDGFYV